MGSEMCIRDSVWAIDCDVHPGWQRPPWHVPPGQAVPSGSFFLHVPPLRRLQGGHAFFFPFASAATGWGWLLRPVSRRGFLPPSLLRPPLGFLPVFASASDSPRVPRTPPRRATRALRRRVRACVRDFARASNRLLSMGKRLPGQSTSGGEGQPPIRRSPAPAESQIQFRCAVWERSVTYASIESRISHIATDRWCPLPQSRSVSPRCQRRTH